MECGELYRRRGIRQHSPPETFGNQQHPHDSRHSRQVLFDLREQSGEVEPVGAGGAGGLEVGAGPVAGLGGERGVLAAGLGAVAVVLVVGQEPGQVAELGLGAGGDRAAAVAVGAERRAVGERRRRGAGRISAAFSGSKRRAASAFSRIWSVFRIETHDALIRSSVQIACSRPWNGVSFRSASIGTRRTTSSRMFPLGLSPRNWPAICFIEIRPIPFFRQASSALFSGESLSSQGVYWSMIASTIPPSAAAWMIWARSLWWVEKPTNLALPDFRIASAVSLNSWLLTKLMASSRRVVVAEAVDEEEVDVVGPQGRQPLVDHPDHLRRASRGMSLVTRKICLRTSGACSNHFLKSGSER